MVNPMASCCWIAPIFLLKFAIAFPTVLPPINSVGASFLEARRNGTPTGIVHERQSIQSPLGGHSDRRKMIVSSITSIFIYPSLALAGIDVSGLQVQGSSPNADLASKLKQAQYNDGSASRRVQDIRTTVNSPSPNRMNGVPPPPSIGVATWALRATEPVFRKLNFGTTTRYQGRIVGPASSRSSFAINFDFPSDWLQLDKFNGCIQFVDQRNGDKLYIMRVTLPPDVTLATIPKQFFAKALFDPDGSLVASGGLTVEDARVSKDITSPDCSDSNACGRRLLLKFATITGNGLRVERRGVIQAYSSPGESSDVYMMITSSNAVNFEKGGIERETVENIVDSFRIDFA